MKYHKIAHKNPNLDPASPKTSSRLIIKPKNKAQITLSKDNTRLYFVVQLFFKYEESHWIFVSTLLIVLFDSLQHSLP